jgi:hypothetical protein
LRPPGSKAEDSNMNEGFRDMSISGPFLTILRTVGDAFIGLVLFLTFALAISAYERTSVATHRLGDILAVSSSAGELLKFSLNDSPLIAAAVVATAVPVPHSGTTSRLPRTTGLAAFLLLGGIFSALVAFNLAFFRHLRREYASPR